jgi:hypothetical protein
MKVFELINGEVGIVLSENEFNKKFGNVYCGNIVSDIKDFDFSNCEMFLCESEGYRGFGCYEGIVIKDEKSYYLDIVNDGIVCELEY